MPTLLNKNGFKFFFYANEHEPKHIHIMRSYGFAKIELENLKVVQNYLKPKDLKLALEIVKENKINLKGFGMSGLVKGKEVHFDEEYLHVKLEDNRICVERCALDVMSRS